MHGANMKIGENIKSQSKCKTLKIYLTKLE